MLLSRNFILITLASFIFFFNFHSFLLLPLRIEQVGGSASAIGFIMGMASLSTIVSTPLVGIYADRYGKKIFLILGAFLLSVSTLLFLFVSKIDLLIYSLRFIQGVAFSFFFIAAGSLTADVVVSSKRTQAIGLFGVFTLLNYAIAPYIGKKILQYYSFDVFFKIVFCIGILALPVSLLINDLDNDQNGLRKPVQSNIFTLIFSSKIFFLALTLFFMGAAFIASVTFVPVFARFINVNSFHLFFVSYTLSTLAIRFFCGWIPDRYGKALVIIPSLSLFMISLILLSFTSSLGLLIISGIMFGVSHGFSYPSLYSQVLDNIEKTDRAKGFAIGSLSFTSGGMFGTFIAGVFVDLFGYKYMFMLLALFVFSGFVTYIFNTNRFKLNFN